MRTAIAAAMIMTGLATAASTQNIDGRYSEAGTSTNGASYTGTAEITFTSESTCRIIWRVGSETSRGICMRSGTLPAASYSYGKYAGLTLYELKPDGTLVGRWTIADTPGTGTDTLTPMR